MLARAVSVTFALVACGSPPREVKAPEVPVAKPPDADAVPFGPDDRAAELAALRDGIRDVYAHLDTKRKQWGVDLDALYKRYEPAIRAADTWSKYERVTVAFVTELHDGHIQWRRKRAKTEAKRKVVRLGLDTVFVGEALIVSNVWDGSDARRAGLAVGDHIVAIDDISIPDRMKALSEIRSWSRPEAARYDFALGWAASRTLLTLPPKPRRVTREVAGGKRDTLQIIPETTPRPGGPRPPIELVWRNDIAILHVRSLDGRVAETKKQATAIAKEIFAKSKGLVIDLRGNEGGFEKGAHAIIAQLTTRRIVAGTHRVKLSSQARAAHSEWRDLAEDPILPGWSKPMPQASDGVAARDYPNRIAVMIDAGCGSSCETLALMFRVLGGKLFGQQSAGMSGAPVTITLARSGARVRIPARAAFDLAGQPIEGNGVGPDEFVSPTRTDVTSRRDAVLERAVDFVCPLPAGGC